MIANCVMIFLVVFVLSWLTSGPAAAQDVQSRDWSGACTGCHGTEGRSSGAIPAIAGIDKVKFVELMTAFRNGTQQTTIMHQLASGLSEEQIDALGDYFSSRSPM